MEASLKKVIFTCGGTAGHAPAPCPEWLIRLLQIISGVLFVAVACLAVYGLYRLVYRWILGRKEKKDRRQWVEETGFTDFEMKLNITK